MKKVLLFLFVLLLSCLGLKGQDKTLRFMNIPVDGKESEMASSLERKGFLYDEYQKGYRGQFNGQTVTVFIHTNHDVVDRIFVSFTGVNEYEIKGRYNDLLSSFNSTGKYFASPMNSELSDDVNIYSEITTNGNGFDANFWFIPGTREEIVESIVSVLMKKYSGEEVVYYVNKIEEIENSNGKSVFEMDNEEQEKMIDFLHAYYYAIGEVKTGDVWFRIFKDGMKYHIGLYYDNCLNRPKGEDL